MVDENIDKGVCKLTSVGQTSVNWNFDGQVDNCVLGCRRGFLALPHLTVHFPGPVLTSLGQHQGQIFHLKLLRKMVVSIKKRCSGMPACIYCKRRAFR
jgi:hypothetical protein